MNDISNLDTAKRLVEKYRSITIEKVLERRKEEHVLGSFYLTAQYLTNFHTNFCSLCQAAYSYVVFSKKENYYCEYCIYCGKGNCKKGSNQNTFNAIREAQSAEELVAAFRSRADHIESLINNIENDNNLKIK